MTINNVENPDTTGSGMETEVADTLELSSLVKYSLISPLLVHMLGKYSLP